MFSSQLDNCIPPFVHIFDIISLFAAELEEPKIGLSGKRLKNTLGGVFKPMRKDPCLLRHESLFVWGFMPYQQYFSYLKATAHKSMSAGLFFNQYFTSPLSQQWRVSHKSFSHNPECQGLKTLLSVF